MTIMPVVALAASILLAGGGQDRPTGEALVTDLFSGIFESFRKDGVEPVEEFTADYRMAPKSAQPVEFTVAGGSYAIMAVCDESCRDIDLRVGTVAGEVLGEDLLEDDVPTVSVKLAPGPYRMVLAMENCAAQTCLSRLKVLRIG